MKKKLAAIAMATAMAASLAACSSKPAETTAAAEENEETTAEVPLNLTPAIVMLRFILFFFLGPVPVSCFRCCRFSLWEREFQAVDTLVSLRGNCCSLAWKLLFPCVETAVSLRRHCRFLACILLFPCVETSGFGSRSRSGTGCLLRQLRIKSSFVKQRYVILFIAFAG